MGSVEGTPFGRYQLIKLLGRGGMGEVWRAHDTETGRMVALKLLPANVAADDVFQQRFRREAYAAAALNEPHVIPIHNFGEIDGRLYVDMRLVEGRDLQSVLAAGPLPPARAVVIVEQVAAALEAAHQIGLVHRDVKPSNVLVTQHDFAYLIDFGIARAAGDTSLTGTRGLIGTWHYMAPERFRAEDADARSDIYSLACVLYECLTAIPPFPGDTVESLVAAHLSTPPPRLSTANSSVLRKFDGVIAKGMAKDPGARYLTTLDLAEAARTALSTPMPQPSPPPAVLPIARAAATTYVPPSSVATPPPPPPGFLHDGGPQPTGGAKAGLSTGAKVAIGLATVLVLAAVIAVTAVVTRMGNFSGGSSANVSSSSEHSQTPISEPSKSTAMPSSTPASSVPGAPKSLTGKWSGPVLGDQSGFDVVADIVDGRTLTATVSYPQLGCEGTWTQRGAAGNGVRFVSEKIAHGTCVPSEVTLTPQDDGTLYYTAVYYAASQQRNLAVHATLSRS